jgi:signal transduction histidine kinase
MIPNTILYILLNIGYKSHIFPSNFLTITQIEFDDMRDKLLICSTLCVLFNCTIIDTNDIQYKSLKTTCGKRTMYVIIMYTLSKISYISALFITTEFLKIIAQILIYFCYAMATLGAVYLIIILLYYDIQHFDVTRFTNHNVMSDFLHSIVLLLFLICLFIIWCLDFIEFYLYPIEKFYNFAQILLYMQLLLIFVFTVIPLRCHQRLAVVKAENLQIRLNLIRYVSHEMRTPLNTAVLGIKLTQEDLDAYANEIHLKLHLNNDEE